MEQQFVDKCILITGGAGDIGRGVAHWFLKRGAKVVLLDINKMALADAQKQLSLSNSGYVCDVSSWTAVKEVVSLIDQEQGPIDFLFNNAGYQGNFQPTHLYESEDFQNVLMINTLGIFNILKAVSYLMVSKQIKGSVVNVASMAGVNPPPNMIAYGASKAAVIAMTESAALDLAPYDIRVNAISPAFMKTNNMWYRQVELQAAAGTQYFSNDPNQVEQQMIESIPMRRCGTIEEIAGVVEFLLSKKSSYITGVNIPISGGII